MRRLIFIIIFLFLTLPTLVWAGDAVTVIFKSGQVVYIEYGYQKIVDQVKSSIAASKRGNFIELTINGGTFLLSLDEVAVVCRDDCRNLVVSHQQDPKRAK